MKKQRVPSLRSLKMGFTLCIFIILAITISFFSGLELVLTQIGWLRESENAWTLFPVLVSALVSLPLGTLVTTVFLHFPMRPIKRLLKSMKRLADGHFEERLDFEGVSTMKEMEDTFNALASELQNTEMLRSDFVNHFSHEFKTPIVSLRGFARLLQRGDLTEEQRREYVDIIVDESTRLANMATNVLNLTKIENQTILTDTSEFNLSEQLRRCILLLEKKWTAKEMEIAADFQEFMISADQEMLKEVWLNLLDNAIKFSPHGGEIGVNIVRRENSLHVSVHNHGPVITEEQKKRLFDKFWQGDSSHASEGTGIGLSIARKIVELHNGSILVDSRPEETVFTVLLPEKLN